MPSPEIQQQVEYLALLQSSVVALAGALYAVFKHFEERRRLIEAAEATFLQSVDKIAELVIAHPEFAALDRDHPNHAVRFSDQADRDRAKAFLRTYIEQCERVFLLYQSLPWFVGWTIKERRKNSLAWIERAFRDKPDAYALLMKRETEMHCCFVAHIKRVVAAKDSEAPKNPDASAGSQTPAA